MLITNIRGVEVHSCSSNITVELTYNHIILGNLFNKLSKDSQVTLLNRALIGIEYVNSKFGSLNQREIDNHMNKQGYNLTTMIESLKNEYDVYRKFTTDQSERLLALSSRILDLKSIALNSKVS